MTVNDIAADVQAQLLGAVKVVQDTVVTTLEWITDQSQSLLPETASRFTDRLPQATHYVDRGFETAEQWLRTQHDFASKLAGVLQPSAQPTTTPTA